MGELPTSIKFIFSNDDRVDSEPTVPGTMIVTESGQVYLDQPITGDRVKLTDIKVYRTDADRLAIMEPSLAFYYVIETAKLYRYLGDHRWDCLNPDPPFIGSDGKVLNDYLPDDVVILGPGGVVPEGYLAMATSNRYGTIRLGSPGGAARYGEPSDAGLGNLTNDAQVKLTDIETDEPSGVSSDSTVTSARRLHHILGGQTSELATEAKTLIGAINELSEKIEKMNDST